MPSSENSVDVSFLEITPETALLVDNQNETYSLFVDGEYKRDIKARAIIYEPYCSLQIIKTE